MPRDRQIRWALIVSLGFCPAVSSGCLKSSNVRATNGSSAVSPSNADGAASPLAGAQPNSNPGQILASPSTPPAELPTPPIITPRRDPLAAVTAASIPAPSARLATAEPFTGPTQPADSGLGAASDGIIGAPTPMLDAAARRLEKIKAIEADEPPAATAVPRLDPAVERVAAASSAAQAGPEAPDTPVKASDQAPSPIACASGTQIQPAPPASQQPATGANVAQLPRPAPPASSAQPAGGQAQPAPMPDSVTEPPSSPPAPVAPVHGTDVQPAPAATLDPNSSGAFPPPKALEPGPPESAAVDQLAIRDVHLCRSIDGFGAFEPLATSSVHRGQRVLIYCEMDGVRYERRDDAYMSRIASRIELRSADDGQVRWEHELGSAQDSCRSRRRDYYVNYVVELPTTLTPGAYCLMLMQTDLIANRAASTGIPIEIAAEENASAASHH